MQECAECIPALRTLPTDGSALPQTATAASFIQRSLKSGKFWKKYYNVKQLITCPFYEFQPIIRFLEFLQQNSVYQSRRFPHCLSKCEGDSFKLSLEWIILPVELLACSNMDRDCAHREKGGQIRFFTNSNSSVYSWLCRGEYSHWKWSYISIEVSDVVDFDRGRSEIGVGETRRKEWYGTFWTNLRHGGGVDHL